ncbi:probable serine/threonine-protein kinase DDB_G0280133 [Condylostylus longicornis]|uniref:probable serine/threonine-protein kinase DDB_G0280133 n=1 Tax=Condylostylus longicornis TaxID=2530218 RepID=UPI00244E485C|nr:probable serine/threonine-protein kinase DDB_G0280133 [Condylostylus longicornis]
MKSLLSVVLLLSINPGQPLSYPTYGTKRYHRTSASSSYIPPNHSYQLNSYYDNQPILTSSSSSTSTSGSSTGSNQLSSYGSLPYSLQNYPNTNLNNNNNNGYIPETNNNYYYYPHHEYRTYGMPTYHGEYKPKPYYYAPAPRYSYFDDHEITSNPFDDLHEEMLHEDERIQHRQILQDQPAYFGKENWYQTGPSRQDELTNNFLRNLIAYNRQLEQQERERQLAEQAIDDEYMQRDQYAVYNNEPEPEYDDYSEIGDYEYENSQPIEPKNVLERKKFETIQANQQEKFLQEQKQRQQYQNKLNEVDDEDVRQLKNLAKYSKQNTNDNSHLILKQEDDKISKPIITPTYNFDKTTSQKDQKSLKPENSANSVLKSNTNYDYKSQQNKYIEPVEPEQIEDSDEWYTPQQSSNSNSEKSSYSSVPQYDEPEEYYEEDDGAWISWDRKRSNDRAKINFESIPKKIDLIKAFNDRKPQNIKFLNAKTSSELGESQKISTTTTISSIRNSLIKNKLTTTPSPFLNKKSTTISSNIVTSTVLPVVINKMIGQKEVVLPRPASISQHIFSAPILNLITNKDSQQNAAAAAPSSDSSHKLQNKLNRNSDAIYKTIKQLMQMENNLDQDSKKHKRFVTNEENLVNELDKLKRQTKS